MRSKIIRAVTIGVLAAILASCNYDSSSHNNASTKSATKVFNRDNEAISTISPVKLTAREDRLLTYVGIQNELVYAVKGSGIKANSGEFWIDHYEYGKFKGALIRLSSSMSTEDTIYHAMLAIQETYPNSNLQNWHLSFANGSTTFIPEDRKRAAVVTAVKMAGEKKIEKGKDIMIGIIAQGKSTAVIPDDIFENEKSKMKDLIKNEEVYILRCKFK